MKSVKGRLDCTGSPHYSVLVGLITTGTTVVCIHRLRKTKINLS